LNAAPPDRPDAGAVRAAMVWVAQAAWWSSKNGRSGSCSTVASGGPASLAVALLIDAVGQEQLVAPQVRQPALAG
jgi:hypothetical protein